MTERDSIVVRFIVENRKERAFLAKLYVIYNQDELDEPHMVNNPVGIDVERKEHGLAVINLGNPLEEHQKLSFGKICVPVNLNRKRFRCELQLGPGKF